MYLEERIDELEKTVNELKNVINTLKVNKKYKNGITQDRNIAEYELITLDSVMNIFNVTRTTICRWISKGYLEQRKLGCSNKVYFTTSSVENLISKMGVAED